MKNTIIPHFQAQQKSRRGQKKLKFTNEDDKRLAKYVAMVGDNDWSKIASLMGDRNGRQCRERWNNYVNPNLRLDPWTQDEITLLLKKYQELGPKWNRIAKFFRNRSTNSVKNKWLTLRRKEQTMYYEFRKTENPQPPPPEENYTDNNINRTKREEKKPQEHIIFPSLIAMIPDKDSFYHHVILQNTDKDKV